MDDLSHLSYTTESAQRGNNRLEILAETKLLDYNLSKCFVIILGEKNARKKLLEEFNEKPPKLYGKNVEIVTQESYLGDELGIGVSESISLTIKKRTGLVKKSIFEIVAVV